MCVRERASNFALKNDQGPVRGVFLFLWDAYNYIAVHVSPRKNMVHGRHHFHFFGLLFFFSFIIILFIFRC